MYSHTSNRTTLCIHPCALDAHDYSHAITLAYIDKTIADNTYYRQKYFNHLFQLIRDRRLEVAISKETGSTGSNTQVIVAIIGVIGVLGGALFANWDKIFPPDKPTTPAQDIVNNTQNETNSSAVATNTNHADLSFIGWSFTPKVPVKGQQVEIRIGIKNQGASKANSFVVEWWSSISATAPAKRWQIAQLAAGAEQELTYRFAGYPSAYSNLKTRVVIDPDNKVSEKDKSNNTWTRSIQVNQPGYCTKADSQCC